MLFIHFAKNAVTGAFFVTEIADEFTPNGGPGIRGEDHIGKSRCGAIR
jgi:hypothetical protein